jgi:pimeloyl-ACP methyl ester carboxylesterase
MTSFNEKTTITDDNISIYYRHYGTHDATKPTIFCLPGLTRNSKAFDAYAVYCVQKFQTSVICPDMRGRGQSGYDSITMNYNIFREAQDIFHIITHENIQNCIIVGTSRGGMQATLLASLLGSRLKAVILNDIGAIIPMTALQRLKRLFSITTNIIGDYDTALKAFYRGDNGMTQGLTLQQEHDIIHQLFKCHDNIYYLDYDYIGLGHAYDASITQMQSLNPVYCDLKPLFISLANTPTLLLHGKNSDILTFDAILQTKALLPHIQNHTFDNRGHVLYFNEPEVISVCDDFLGQYISLS